MIVRCVGNTGMSLAHYEYEHLFDKNTFGRFGTSEDSEYPIVIGKEYLVMGLIVFKDYQAYLIDDDGYIVRCPCQLFEIVDSEINSNWHFRTIDREETIYPFVQAIFGYPELCSDIRAFEKLIIDRDQEAQQIYFRRKIELERKLKDDC